jgi:hypothetical protein
MTVAEQNLRDFIVERTSNALYNTIRRGYEEALHVVVDVGGCVD